MTSPRQTAANRGNAQHSTGPRTAEGRNISSMNALKHGLRARTVLLDGEDEDEFRLARANFLADLAPRGFLEQALAGNVVSAWWQLKRAQGVEATVLDLELLAGAEARNRRQQAELAARLGHKHLIEGAATAPGLAPETAEKLAALLGDESDPEAQAFNGLMAQQRALELLRAGLEAQPGHAFARDAGGADVLGKLSRYHTAAQRRFHAALREFERVRKSEDRGQESVIGSRQSEAGNQETEVTGSLITDACLPSPDPCSLSSDSCLPSSNRAERRRAARNAEREAPRLSTPGPGASTTKETFCRSPPAWRDRPTCVP